VVNDFARAIRGALLFVFRLSNEFPPFSRVLPSASHFGLVHGVNHLVGQGWEFAIWAEVVEEILLVLELYFAEVIKGRCALMTRRVGS
jgi:hypothetical protein